MKTEPASAVATMLFTEKHAFDFTRLMQEIVDELCGAGYSVSQIRLMPKGQMMLEAAGRELIVAHIDVPLGLKAFQSCARPVGTEADMSRARIGFALRNHQGAFVTSVGPESSAGAKIISMHPGDNEDLADVLTETATDEQARKICQIVTGAILAQSAPKLVIWHPTNTIFTAHEFSRAEFPMLCAEAVDTQESLVLPAIRKRPRPAQPEWGKKFDQVDTEALSGVASAPPSIRRRAPAKRDNGPSPYMLGLRGFAANDRPELPAMRADELMRVHEALRISEEEEIGNPERKAPVAHRLTTYGLSASLMMVSLPIGAAVMTYNCLGRENLNVTARLTAVVATAKTMALLFLGPEVVAFI